MQINNSFLDVCQQYFQNSILLPLFVIALIWMLLKWNREKRIAFCVIGIVCVLILFNPVFYRIVDSIGEGSTYYRFFWIIPITLVISAVLVELISFFLREKKKIGIFIVILIGLVFSPRLYSDWLKIPTNIYQLDEDVIQVADTLMELTNDQPTTLLDSGEIKETIRQYNAKIKFTELYTEYINQVICTDKADYLGRYMQDYISMNASQYIAIEKEKTVTYKLIESAGVQRAAETDGYYLYHVDHEAIDTDWFVLLDYEEGICNFANIEYVLVPGMKNEYEYIYISDFGPIENEDAYREIVEEINASNAEAVFINTGQSIYSDWVSQYEELLEDLQIPYYWNNKDVQVIENEDIIFCMVDNVSNVSEIEIEEVKRLNEKGKPIILILTNMLLEDASDELYRIVTAEDSRVVQILTTNPNRSIKNLINNSFLQYATPVDVGQTFNIIRVKALEEQK